ncbi:hypothetical protein FOZ61_001696 [Perkinsus olseni]|uniref:Uncharacterized protein n=1 Tax=Perkinsus olseni TaxID=32597 RepID=A0A7J6KPW9_PEROL|nr:hypothetical protein FOZ61_001696 [Perkinsus olseni]KAF4649729.1 hypothetical protein FOL46_001536 [Perkinsus olseni]
MSYSFVGFKFNEDLVPRQLAPMRSVGLFSDSNDVKSFQQEMMIMLEPFRASKWIEEHKKLEAEEAGSGDLRVLNSVYYSISSELMDAGYLDFVEDELPPTAEPAMNFLSYAALWVSRGKTIASMSKRNALADAVIKAFPQPTPSSTSSNAAYKSTESLTTDANGVLSLKAFRDEVQTANTLPMIETYNGEGDKVSAIKWKSDVEDQSGPMGSPIVTFYYAKRTCDAVSWKELTGKDFENLSRDYATYRKALKSLQRPNGGVCLWIYYRFIFIAAIVIALVVALVLILLASLSTDSQKVFYGPDCFKDIGTVGDAESTSVDIHEVVLPHYATAYPFALTLILDLGIYVHEQASATRFCTNRMKTPSYGSDAFLASYIVRRYGSEDQFLTSVSPTVKAIIEERRRPAFSAATFTLVVCISLCFLSKYRDWLLILL